jgi:hypothetical protein
MGFLKTNYDNTGFDALPIGDYECIVSSTEIKTAESGNRMIKCKLTIREDVDQKGKKRNFFDNLVILDSMMWKFNQVAKAVQIPEGEDVDTPEEFAAAILYKPVVIRNKHEMYNGEKTDKIAAWKPSQLEGGSAPTGDPFAGSGQIDISDDDLPF